MNHLPFGACARGGHARCAHVDQSCPCPCHHDERRRGGQGRAGRPEATVRAVLAAARKLQDTHRRGSAAYAYAAGVEDALGWLVGQVSPEVFRGFSPDMAALSAAARIGRGRP